MASICRANIGGSMGLCMGASMLSLCELLEILIEMALIKFKSNSARVFFAKVTSKN
jgi:hypothetical protein